MDSRKYGLAFFVAAAALCVAIGGGASPALPAPAATPTELPGPEHLLNQIRLVFRAHRPPPPYVEYTIVREQNDINGFPDYVDSYTEHIWCRTSDRAALARRVYRDDYRGDMTFERPAFNEPRDPGPPTADVFEKAPATPHPVEFVPTAEPSGNNPAVIATVRAFGELEYRVTNVAIEGRELHLSVIPRRDPDRNRLREIYVDRKTLELRKLVATDKLFVDLDPKVYAVSFTITMGMLDGMPVVTDIHGDVDPSYSGDGEKVEYHFKDISFPKSMPDWYFNAREYAQHQSQAPI
ncbi:MAG: hypothetical protein JOZ38_08575 [Candidatus Eremiobacteraeota bacterium]|nr:hypothetical protein [Candidatus Eremiobacteraeota bacterium]